MKKASLVVLLLAAAAAGQNVIVVQNGDLQGAIDSAQPGDIVELREDVVTTATTDKPLTIRSDPNGPMRWITGAISAGMGTTALRLEGLGFVHDGQWEPIWATRVHVPELDLVVIEGCIVLPKATPGTRAIYAACVAADRVFIRDTYLVGTAGRPGSVCQQDEIETGCHGLGASGEEVIIENCYIEGGAGGDVVVDCWTYFNCRSSWVRRQTGNGAAAVSLPPNAMLVGCTIVDGEPGRVIGGVSCNPTQRGSAGVGGASYGLRWATRDLFVSGGVIGRHVAIGMQTRSAFVVGFNLVVQPTPYGPLCVPPVAMGFGGVSLQVPNDNALRGVAVVAQGFSPTAGFGNPSGVVLR